ncbi:hypothetical protein KKA15_02350 [Patescibacteria group bacterium]|nr:hypothetical protein [Patescibacteria group bacterium]
MAVEHRSDENIGEDVETIPTLSRLVEDFVPPDWESPLAGRISEFSTDIKAMIMDKSREEINKLKEEGKYPTKMEEIKVKKIEDKYGDILSEVDKKLLERLSKLKDKYFGNEKSLGRGKIKNSASDSFQEGTSNANTKENYKKLEEEIDNELAEIAKGILPESFQENWQERNTPEQEEEKMAA